MRAGWIALLGLCWTAEAQDVGGVDAHGFKVAPQDGDVRDFYRLTRPGRMAQWEWYAAGVFEYANRPLLRYARDDAGERTVEPVLDHLGALNVAAGLTVHRLLRFDAALPLYFVTAGDERDAWASAIGDLRMSATFAFVQPGDERRVGLGVVPFVDLPTGDSERFLGQRTVAGGVSMAATLEWHRLTASAEVGARFNPTVDVGNLAGNDVVQAGAGVAYVVTDSTGVAVEASLDIPFRANAIRGAGMPAEAIASVRHRTGRGMFLSGGFAAPLSAGVGAARFRVFVGGGFGGSPASP